MSSRTGFDDPGEGSERPEPEALNEWIAAGFAETDANVWRGWRMSIATAQEWMAAGVTDGLTAAQWSIAGARPTTVGSWRAAGIEAAEAIRWHEFGADFEEAKREKEQGHSPEDFLRRRPSGGRMMGMVGPQSGVLARWRNVVDPRVMHTYFQASWVDDDALAWGRQGVPASDAYLWHDLGLRPHEVARLLVRGVTIERVVREWWQAGIPIDEVADWLAAGFSANEALEQRAKGVSGEEAAALRALRLDEPEPEVQRHPQRGNMMRQGPPPRSRPGPPPEDENNSRSQIAEAFSRVLTLDGMQLAVEGGDRARQCLDHARELLREPEVTKLAVKVDRIEFLNDHEARVFLDTDQTMRMGPRPQECIGRAVLVDGAWKVARETFCQLVNLAGFECP